MDRPISTDDRRLKIAKKALPFVLAAGGVGIVSMVLVSWLRPSVKRSEIRTAVVERGTVEATLSASGTVVPEHERVITSPVDTRVLRVLKTPGDRVAPGEPIVELDVSGSNLELMKIKDRLALKRVEKDRAKQDLAARVTELRSQREVKALELKNAQFEADRCRKHMADGIFSGDELRRVENLEEKARIELEKSTVATENAEQSARLRLRELDLECAIIDKERDEAEHVFSLAQASSDQAGVLTWVLPGEGMTVRKGDVVARVSDLSAFRVDATVSDVHGAKVSAGMPALVITGDSRLEGRVEHVLPTVDNGVITLKISLNEPRHPVLRHNLRIEVYVVTSRAEGALRVKRGSFPTLDGKQYVFVVLGRKAVRKEVRLGITSFEFSQVLDGLNEGGEVILSDMSEFVRAREVKLR
jgi:HlyD family secretion protein